jgi:hypothetical protein
MTKVVAMRHLQLPYWTLTVVAFVVLIVWGVTFMVDMSDADLEIPLAFHGGAVIVIGLMIAAEVRRQG